MIAHRIQSVKNADLIVVFKDFEIQDMGTFDELIQRCTYFCELWDRNESQEVDADEEKVF